MTLALALPIAAHVHPSSSSSAFFEPTDRRVRRRLASRRGREEKSLSPTLSRLHLVARQRASNFVHSSSRKSINHRNQAIRRHSSVIQHPTPRFFLFLLSSPLRSLFHTRRLDESIVSRPRPSADDVERDDIRRVPRQRVVIRLSRAMGASRVVVSNRRRRRRFAGRRDAVSRRRWTTTRRRRKRWRATRAVRRASRRGRATTREGGGRESRGEERGVSHRPTRRRDATGTRRRRRRRR